MDQADFLKRAGAILGPGGLVTDQDIIAPWLTDWRGRFTGRTLAMAAPRSAEDLSALVRLCAEHAVAIVPQGGNSGMCGGATPDATGNQLLLSLRRMARVRAFDPAEMRITCEAGLVLENLHAIAAEAGLRFPLTLGGKGSATVGGLISTNAGGTQVLRHGTMRGLVLGLEAVLADGSLYSALTPLKKDNRGFDLKQILIGSEGTMGIVTAATLKLAPAIVERIAIWAGVPSLQVARRLLLHCERSMGNAVEGFEVIPASSLAAVLAYLPGARAPLGGDHAWHVLIEVVAESAGAGDLRPAAETMMVSAAEAELADDAVFSASEAQAEAFWALRDSVAPAERAKGPALQHDISVPVERMPDFVDAAIAAIEGAHPGVSAIAFGHLGDGNVHFHVIAPPGVQPVAWEIGPGKAISRQVYDMVTEWGGSISAEHGIGQVKREEFERLGDPVQLALLRALKRAVDPGNLLNPGKLVTLAPEPGSP